MFARRAEPGWCTIGALLGWTGCAAVPDAPPPVCDPRALEAGEVRARPLLCTDELVSGGEGRIGDFLVENAVARFVVRGSYASLTWLDEDGGTLVDAAAPGTSDILLELMPDVDRSSVEPAQGDGWAELREPGLTWHLDADRPSLELRAPADDPDEPADAAPDGFATVLRPDPGVSRTGSTFLYGDLWMGVDGEVGDGVEAVDVTGVTRVSLTTAERWPDGEPVELTTDAADMRVDVDGTTVTRLPVAAGVVSAVVPVGATLTPETSGCVWRGLHDPWCGRLTLEVRDQDGRSLPVTVSDGDDAWVIREYEGDIRIGPRARTLTVSAGPAYSHASFWYDGTDVHRTLTLWRDMDLDGAVLADLDRRAAPDPSTNTPGWEALHDAYGAGYTFAALVADDEIPSYDRYGHDRILPVVASRAADLVWSWPWTASTKRWAHGAVPWQGLSALDLLTVSRGGASVDRVTVVRPAWVTAAAKEAAPSAWPVSPDALWLSGPVDLPTYLWLLDAWQDVAPVGPYTWVEVGPAVNEPAIEAGILQAHTTAGNGPRVRVAAERLPFGEGANVRVTVDASRWMGVDTVTLYTAAGPRSAPIAGRGVVDFEVRSGSPWAVAVVSGSRVEPPYLDEPAWAVSGPVWLRQPDGTPTE